MPVQASGIVFRVRSTGAVLLLQRGPDGDAPSTWAPPGGKREDGETAQQTAVREAGEEAGPKARRAAKNLKLLARRIDEAADFTTFLAEVDEPFDVELDDESTAFAWVPADTPPEPLHPGARVALAKLSANELEVARMMVRGELTSPQFYANMMLLDIRITGTGVAYRKTNDEFCYRAPENYLTPDFLARCNGLPVLWDHPEGAVLTSKEYQDRSVGTVFLPYVREDAGEVWAIAKIYDDWAIDQLTNGEDWSTSPTVDFGAGVVVNDTCRTMTVRNDDGTESKLLLEGDPPLLDHIALCSKGVWDKGGAAAGVNTARADKQMADEDDKKRDDAAKADQAKADAAKADQAKADAAKADAENDRFNKLMDSISALSRRMDSWDEEKKADKRRKDEDEEAKKANEAAKEPGAGDDGEVERKAKSDKAKKDSDDEMADKAKKDAAKKDEDKDDEKKSDAARADAAEQKLAEMRADVAALRREFASSVLSDADHTALSGAQARADAVYQQFGQHAPRPLAGETDIRYRRRIAADLKQHSKEWKDTDVMELPDSATFKAIETRIYADAVAASRDPVGMPDGELREVRVRDPIGNRERLEFHGRPSWWMSDFMQKPLGIKFTRPNQN